MSHSAGLLTDRWRPDGAMRVAFEGPFGDEKRLSMSETDAGAVISSLREVLLAHGVAPGSRVGVLSKHRIETYLAVLAEVTTGATFVPLNPKFPADRLRTIIELSNPTIMIGDRTTSSTALAIASSLPFIDAAAVPPSTAEAGKWLAAVAAVPATGGDTAYLMFTSGSTGTPKGVPISYDNLAHYVDGVSTLLALPDGLRFTQFFDLSFDLSMHDIFVSMRHRGTLVAPTQIDMMMPGGYVARERIDAWFSVPLLGAQLGSGKRKDGFGGLRSMLFCGEALPMETVEACRPWLADRGRMWNLYGPTEATIAFTAADVTESSRSEGNASIGRPFGSNRTALLRHDTSVAEQPMVGDEGELLLGGPQVFEGYSTDAPSPFIVQGDKTYYRSGDLVRIDEEGVYFRGRVDSQVKFRGYRIELGEIETVARRKFARKTVAVVVVGDGAEAKLVLYCLASEDPDGSGIDLRLLEDTLPSYMVPTMSIALDAMPTNQNGKIDRRALAALACNG